MERGGGQLGGKGGANREADAAGGAGHHNESGHSGLGGGLETDTGAAWDVEGALVGM